ncbi:MAG: 2-oxoglutarate dehydrogenase E1 component, partial [Alphaproteobacteria bacterium]|nr:2-oxoglutarate dehydrogenase E1 component [Alphaproteobacteria bacterium]MDX5370339.1 2-oxoglutarate dehydrogenase E1 component [Alphaproteobacteria bacterium]MDX5464877.1 2-oxoglutarate dehydrogenase E1 component [Alphaproteobacteria bacterium]
MGQDPRNEAFELTSFLSGANALYVEQLYARYKTDPGSVDSSWRDFFDGLGDGAEAVLREAQGAPWERADWPPKANGEMIAVLDGNWPVVQTAIEKKVEARQPALSREDVRQVALDSIRAIMMIRAYRIRGHLKADLDPLGIVKKEEHPELDYRTYGFTEADLDRKIFIDFVLGLEEATLREILAILERTYCSTIGVEFMHISSPDEKAWIQARIEGRDKEITFTTEGKKAILNKLIEAEGFEKFLHVKHTGTKRFGLDGGEALIPAMEQIIKRGGHLGVKDIVIGMPHRGRLNILANVMQKP